MTDPAAESGQTPAVRASDDERHRVVEQLGDHAAAGRITLAELEERVARAYAAKTRGELAELTTDLPATTASAAPARPRRKPSKWLLAVLGGSSWRGRRRLSGRLNVIAVMGGDDIDLREAEIDSGELVVNVFSIMGGADIYVPDSVEVELSGTALMGGNDERGSARPPRPGAPVIRIRSFAIMGGTDVWRVPSEARGLGFKAARNAAKALERGAPELDR